MGYVIAFLTMPGLNLICMNKKERQNYMADYNRHYYNIRSGRDTVSKIMNNFVLVVQPTQINFKGSDSPVVCSTFGCSNYLTLREQMAGTKCPACMQVKDSRFKHYKI